MSCTTILAGKAITYNGSNIISRNSDSGHGTFTAKKLIYVSPENQPKVYTSVISHLTIELPEKSMGYSAMPNADESAEGIWAGAGINQANVAMSATETLTTNPRVLAGDPYVVYDPIDGTPGGIGEEDMVTLVLPYIFSAREGVKRLGRLLETYGTYEPNGIAFCDEDEIWYMETIGGHHWIAKRLPENCYAVIANQFSIDEFDLKDALGKQETCMASGDLLQFITNNHLDLNTGKTFSARLAFGSHTLSDHVYNTPRVWYGQRYFNPNLDWETISPQSDELPFCRMPENKITIEDIKTVLSSCYEETRYNPYRDDEKAGLFRPIGINRTDFAGLLEIIPDMNPLTAGIEWFGFGCNVYNVFVPQFTHVSCFPDYFSNTAETVTSESFYWACRIIAALADPHHYSCMNTIRRYQLSVGSKTRAILQQAVHSNNPDQKWLETLNQQIADVVKKETDLLLGRILYTSSMGMKNQFSLNDN